MSIEKNDAALEALLAYRAPYKKPALKAEEAGIFNNTSHVGEPVTLAQQPDSNSDDEDDEEDDDGWLDEDIPF